MIFKINYNGKYEDSFIVEGETIEEIRNTTLEECAKRGWEIENCWSESLSD